MRALATGPLGSMTPDVLVCMYIWVLAVSATLSIGMLFAQWRSSRPLPDRATDECAAADPREWSAAGRGPIGSDADSRSLPLASAR